MGIMDTPSFAAGFIFKVPFYALIFYAFNTLTFGLSMMDSVLFGPGEHLARRSLDPGETRSRSTG